jgi:outer membrane immunogenic protein
MKKLLLASVAAGALAAAGSANAGDLPVPAYPPPPPYPYTPPPPPPPPPFSWSGCYLGGHVGWGWSKTNFQDANLSSSLLLIAPSGLGGSASVNSNGGIFGGQLGCDFEVGHNFVYGAQLSAAGSTITGSGADPYAVETLQSKTEFLGDLSLRVGFDWDGVLLYLKGGGALANNQYGDTTLFLGPPAFTSSGTTTATPFGGVAGAGLEWAFARNWSAFVEYDHYFFSNYTVTFSFPPAGGFPSAGNYLVNVGQNIDAVKAGINLRLYNGP